MKRAIRLLIAAYLVFLVLLAFSGMLGGILSDAVYLLAFAVPIALALTLNKDEEKTTPKIKLGKEGFLLFLPTAAPILTGVLALSLLTSFILGLLGYEDTTAIEGNIFSAMLSYALITPLFEEALFRYLPMRLLAHHSRRSAVVVSALCFSLVHCDLFRIPYAFLAGAAFMLVDIMCDSVLPSFIIHVVNNAMAVLLLFYPESLVLSVTYIAVLCILCAVSAFVIFKRRELYKAGIKRALQHDSLDGIFDISLVAIAIPTLFMAALNIVSK